MSDDIKRHQCAVRQMLLYRNKWGLQQFNQYIKQPSVYRLWSELQDDFVTQWKLGNRGEIGKWL